MNNLQIKHCAVMGVLPKHSKHHMWGLLWGIAPSNDRQCLNPSEGTTRVVTKEIHSEIKKHIRVSTPAIGSKKELRVVEAALPHIGREGLKP